MGFSTQGLNINKTLKSGILMLNFNQKTLEIRRWFQHCKSAEEKYRKIMELGRLKNPMKAESKINQNIVMGCQSLMYLETYGKDGLLYFEAESEALISTGLGVLLTYAFSGENPEIVLKESLAYLEELKIPSILTPSRANGLYSIHLRMRQEALKHLVANPS
ncbi:MAG: hypothetical protein Tsb0021_00700 [Chlamydiales bacterium]